MIAKIKEKEKAIELRKQGLSYREILEKISVAKSSLSLWLRSVSLSKKQKQRLTEKKLKAALRGAEKKHRLRMELWNKIKKESAVEIKGLSEKEKWLMGVVLYWAEGAKEKEYRGGADIKFSNSDVFMIIIFRKWLRRFLKISDNQIRYELYIHEKADWKSAQNFWANSLNISCKNIHVYFKRHNPNPKRKNIGKNYQGLMRLTIYGSANLLRKIDGWISGISKNWGVV